MLNHATGEKNRRAKRSEPTPELEAHTDLSAPDPAFYFSGAACIAQY